LRYFRRRKARTTGLRTTSEGRVSTYRLSHFAGRVINVFVPLTSCLIFWGSLHPAAVRFYRPLLLFGPRRHMNRDRSRDQWESGTLMDRNEVVGTANSTVGIHVKLLQRVKHHNAQINTYDLHFNTRHSLDFVRFRPENSSHRNRGVIRRNCPRLTRIVLHPGGAPRPCRVWLCDCKTQ